MHILLICQSLLYKKKFVRAYNLLNVNFLHRRPTFKTATPTSRTQLKQQLQREHLQELERQEHERREHERKLSVANKNNNGNSTATASSAGEQLASSFAQASGQLQMLNKITHQNTSNLFMPSSASIASTSSSDFFPQTQQYPNQMAAQSTTNTPLKVPLHIGVDLPPQVLKVLFSFDFHLISNRFPSVANSLFSCHPKN